MDTSSDVAEQFAALRQQVLARLGSGDLDGAETLSRQAIKVARQGEDAQLADQALCNLAGIVIARGRGEEVAGELRKLLLRSFNLGNRFLASYALSQHHEQLKEHERSWSYARQALRYAEQWQDPVNWARAHNRIANLYILDSYFEDARNHYQSSLDLLAATPSLERALTASNLGYCLTILGKPTQAFRLLFSSLRALIRLEAGNWQRQPHLSLAYAYLEVGRHDRARQHAQRGLHFALATPGADENVKNALYLLGEAEKMGGRSTAAYECFCDLQKRFYPDQPFILDVLMSTDLRKMINLMA